ncbi:Transcriptional regulator, TetR family [Dokdonella koreensis DS-123]|uniref:Transcriptional regulator, TetR family n=2 Tax=Dokdonella TaxID=323413 RepID=A0A161HRA2_9GAMM|nr:Transcriptional regulator, TetR family [Dokdonella koreensis DS-123]
MEPMTTPLAGARHERVRDAARALWLEHGYQTSMDAIARRAGCSKQTVYAHFGSKEELFRHVVEDLMAPIMACLEPGEGDLEATLTAFARSYGDTLATAETQARRRIAFTEAPRYPDLAKGLYRGGLGHLVDRLAEVLGEAMRRGALRRDDPAQAAELFLGLCFGVESERHLLGVARRRTLAERHAWTDAAVAAFLRAYAPSFPLSLSRKQS